MPLRQQRKTQPSSGRDWGTGEGRRKGYAPLAVAGVRQTGRTKLYAASLVCVWQQATTDSTARCECIVGSFQLLVQEQQQHEEVEAAAKFLASRRK